MWAIKHGILRDTLNFDHAGLHPALCERFIGVRNCCPSIHKSQNFNPRCKTHYYFCLHFGTENRLKKLKGQSSDVTSRDMLRSLSQAKKECWDRFLHDAQTSELFQGGDMDERCDERDGLCCYTHLLHPADILLYTLTSNVAEITPSPVVFSKFTAVCVICFS